MLGFVSGFSVSGTLVLSVGGFGFPCISFCLLPHLSSHASRAFSSGSSVFSSALRAVASSVPIPPESSDAPPLPSVAPVSSSRPPAPLLQAPPFSAPSAVSVASSLPSRVSSLGGEGSAQVVAPAPPGFPPLSAPSALLSTPPPAVPPSSVPTSRTPGVSVLSPPASSLLPSAPFA